MQRSKCLISFMILCAATTSTHGYDGIESDLLKNYDKNALPARNTSVTVSFSLLAFEANPDRQSLTLHLWASLEWTDLRLKWNTSKYPGKRASVALPADLLWHPDLTLYNNAISKDFEVFSKSKVIIKNNGKAMWVPPTTVEAQCTMDLTYWPHDVHNCTAKFGSWVHDAYTMDIISKNRDLDIEGPYWNKETNTSSRNEWKIISSYVKRTLEFYECCPEPYADIKIIFVLKRINPIYSWITSVPTIVLGILTLMVFVLPMTSGERITIGCVSLVSHLYFLQKMRHIIGYSPLHTPLIVQLVAKQLILTLISIIVSVIVLRTTRETSNDGLPPYILSPLNYFSKFIGLHNFMQMDTEHFSNSSEDAEKREGRLLGKGQKDWALLGAFIDRICLIIFVIIILVHIIAFGRVLF